MKRVSASRFKAQCLAVLDEAAAGEEIVVTEHGRPVARVVAADAPASPRGSWEIGTLVRRGRLLLDRDIAARARQALAGLTVGPPDADVALAAAMLDDDSPAIWRIA